MTDRSADAMPRRAKLILPAALVAFATFVVFNANGREIGTYDSQSTKFLAIELAKRHTLALGHVVGRTPALGDRPAFVRDLRGNYRSAYPLPSALIAGATAWVLSTARIIDFEAPLSASLVAKLTASWLTALAVAFAFIAAASRTTPLRAAVVALGFGMGTNLWATVSQTLWQQETALCALMAAIVLLAPDKATVGRCLTVGAMLGIVGWARPQLAPTVMAFALSMVARWGWRTAVGWMPILAAAALAVSINLMWFGHPLGAVPALEALHPAVHGVAGSVETRPWLSALGLLFSPSRGLLVFSPIVALALTGLGTARREGRHSALVWCLIAAGTQFAFYAMYKVWWGGHTFGPRYMLDILPALVPLTAAGMRVIAARSWLRLAAIACLAWSVAVAGMGAFVYPADEWNSGPVDVDRHHDRLWDWRDSQLVRCVGAPWSPQNFAFGSPDAFRQQKR